MSQMKRLPHAIRRNLLAVYGVGRGPRDVDLENRSDFGRDSTGLRPGLIERSIAFRVAAPSVVTCAP